MAMYVTSGSLDVLAGSYVFIQNSPKPSSSIDFNTLDYVAGSYVFVQNNLDSGQVAQSTQDTFFFFLVGA